MSSRTAPIQGQAISTGSSSSVSTSSWQTAVPTHAASDGKSKTASSTVSINISSGSAPTSIYTQPPKSTKRVRSGSGCNTASSSKKPLKSSVVPSNGRASIKTVQMQAQHPSVTTSVWTTLRNVTASFRPRGWGHYGVPMTAGVTVSVNVAASSSKGPSHTPAGLGAAPANGKIVSLEEPKLTSDNAALFGMVASVFGSTADKVMTQDTFDKLKKTGNGPVNGSVDVTIDNVHEASFVWGVEAELGRPASSFSITSLPISSRNPAVQVFVRTLSGETVMCLVDLFDTVQQLKHQVENALGIPVDEQRMLYCGRQLEDERTLLHYGTEKGSTVHLQLRLRAGDGRVIVIKKAFLDPQYDCDFTNCPPDTFRFMRGNEIYERPIGWKRIAINVASKYADDLDWLGPNGARTTSAPNEWPVSYHGTKKEHVHSIAGQGLQLSKGIRFAYGRGIYSTPSLKVAELYAEVFDYKGTKMKVIFQNRINPKTMVKVSSTQTAGRGEFWISPKDSDIRPYGICYKKA